MFILGCRNEYSKTGCFYKNYCDHNRAHSKKNTKTKKRSKMHIDVLIVKNLGLGFENLEIFEEEEELTVNKELDHDYAR